MQSERARPARANESTTRGAQEYVKGDEHSYMQGAEHTDQADEPRILQPGPTAAPSTTADARTKLLDSMQASMQA